jgi:feruloyl esterase
MYYRAVENYLSTDIRDFYRLFMVPGMEHCGGGRGPNNFGGAYIAGGAFEPKRNMLAALVAWVEEEQTPDRIVATKYQDDDPTKPVLRTRPLCGYQKSARWTKKGSTDDARNFECN